MSEPPYVIANWKMHGALDDGLHLLRDMIQETNRLNFHRCILCPPATLLWPFHDELRARDSLIHLGAQNIHARDKGAHTGEISAGMVREAGCGYALIGHSERRQECHESDGQICEKTLAALTAGLIPVVCVGENEEERENGAVEAVLSRQLERGLPPGCIGALDHDPLLLIAYEPVWAIGSGKTPTLEEIAAAHRMIHSIIVTHIGSDPAHRVRILYGGSVNPANAADILSLPEVDGVLVGGASLSSGRFFPILQAAA